MQHAGHIKYIRITLGEIEVHPELLKCPQPHPLTDELGQIKLSAAQKMLITSPIIVSNKKNCKKAKYYLVSGKRTYHIAITVMPCNQIITCVLVDTDSAAEYIIMDAFITKIYLSTQYQIGQTYEHITKSKTLIDAYKSMIRISSKKTLSSVLKKSYNTIFKSER